MKINGDIADIIRKNDVKYIDFRFTDPQGRWHHVTFDVNFVQETGFESGFMFDGSSITGWKSINESDMMLVPDLSSACVDPFFAESTLILICDVYDPTTHQPYDRDPRIIAKKAETYAQTLNLADTICIGPEAEFFIFDQVSFRTNPYETFFKLTSSEFPPDTASNNQSSYSGHHIPVKSGYFPVPPLDNTQDMRSEMLGTMAKMGVTVEKHHHEVASSQVELGIKYNSLVRISDHMQIYKYCVHQVAQLYGKTATFMPKPIYGDNGSGMHVHCSLWRDNKPLFAGNRYADLSQECLYFIGGILKHAKAINAFSNPSTNSYKRLVPGYEAPVLLAYSSRNRSASCRIPWTANPKAKRVEIRFPDPTANPYLCFSAILMAGLYGIVNKIDPGGAIDTNLYEMPPEKLSKIPTVAKDLREALDCLDKDRAFLKAGNVFTDDFIDSYLQLKREEFLRLQTTPHPVEFEMYYSR